MNKKNVAILIALLVAALCIGRWRYGAYEKAQSQTPLGTRVTFVYKGTVGGLFESLATKSGAHYQVNPLVADRPIAISCKNDSVIQVQQVAAQQARLRYSPPQDGSNAIRVDSK